MSRELYAKKAEKEFKKFELESGNTQPTELVKILQEEIDYLESQCKDSGLSKEDKAGIYRKHAAELRREVYEGLFSEVNKCFNCERYFSNRFKSGATACDKIKARLKSRRPERLTHSEIYALEKGALSCGNKYRPVIQDEEIIAEVRQGKVNMRLMLVELWLDQKLNDL